MDASGFGRNAGPPKSGPGSAALAFGAAAATTTPPPVAPPFPAPFPSARPVTSVGAAASRFPGPRPQFAAAAVGTRPGVSAPVPIPLSSGRPAAAAPGASASVRFPSSLTAVDPGAGAATARHVARHLQPQPRVAAPLVSRPVDPIVSSRSRSPPHLPNQYVNSPADYNNGMGQRRLVNYADPLFQNGNAQSSDIGKTTRSPPPHINSKFRPSSSLQNYPPVQIAERNDLARKPNLSPPKLGNQKQSPFHDTHAASSPLLNRNRVVPSSGRPFSAIGIGSSSPPVLVDVAHYDTSTRSMVSQHETSEHVRPQSSLAPFQSRTLDHNISKRSRSPTLSYQDVDGAEARHETGANARRLTDYTDILFEDGNIETSKRMRAPSDFSNMVKFPSSEIKDNIRSSAAGFGSNRAAQNLRSHVDVQKSVASFPEVGSETQSRTSGVRSPPSQMFRLSNAYSNEHNKAAVSPPKPSILGASKRTRTPPLDFSDDDHVMPSTELERENQAKAKRLARFSVELSTPVENVNDFAKAHKGSADKQKQVSPMERLPIGTNDGNDESTLADMDSPGLAVILGLCPDMCPEPERAERERKGDLDRYERLDGDRNQTTELLAVKKYNRTAERDADLIRPLPVLQKTMAYLLSLLDHTYGDDFLGLYNFLWDRMRAIRMDLRMQHFFNREAISMLEQMVRLHIVAMHELCEYNKGEGFSEGFDAHLNIEQMNKTSVELFQMYDDHRRKGVFFSTEKEFRGYYALLKLDKHPGYKVEPAELSLDLAKMSREIRGSSDILFAREVARACRIGNFIAFFRLARKATYLQACLMHAHFAKLRRQALASLHSGLQIGQGIPISHVVGWLAMEDEDIESLAEYHGYVLRQYDEPYLVKEGPFLNSENDFPSGCSQLVHSKKSERVIDDVSYGPVCAHTSEKRETVGLCSGRFASPVSKTELVSPLSALVVPVNARRESGLSPSGLFSPTRGRQVSSPYSGPSSPNTGNKRFSSPYSSSFTPVAGRMESDPVSHSTFSPRASKPASPRASKLAVLHAGLMDEQTISSPKAKGKTTMADESIPEDHDDGLEGLPHEQTELPWSKAYTQDADVLAETSFAHPLADNVASDYSHMHGEGDEFRAHGSDSETDLDEGSPPYREVNLIQLGRPTDSPLPGYEYGDHNINKTKDDLLPIVVSPKKTISSERLKMILRKWRQRAADKRFLREQKNAIAIAALNSLSLGPPVHQTAVVSKHVINELDISHAFKERLARHQRSCSQLNVSELAGPILVERKPDARCLCWKLLVVVPPGDMESQTNNFASKWLLKKLMGFGNEDDGLLFSSASLSIWRKWISHQQTCCLSVVRASDQQVIGNDIANGTGCIIFVVSESISWKIQKARFSSLLASIPAQSNIPLLILSGDTYDEGYDYATQNVIDRLGVSGLREGKIASSLVIFLAGSKTEGYGNGFFDDDKLREGLKWLTSNLPLHPDVVLVKTHDLLLNYLDPSLELLSCRDATDVGPEHCISVFNDAVDQLAEEILAAAYRNPNRWPPLEIDLLERSSNERIFTELFLPNIGWSLPSKIQPLVDIVKSCKLPEFTYDLSELNQGSYLGGQIQDQKLFLEDCLTTYLTQSARLLKDAQAVAETKIMVQKGAVVELRDSDYYLVPKWVTIFRRIYNWRLAKLSTGEFSEAYVLRQRLYQAPADQNVAPQLGLSVDRDTMDKASVLDDYNMIPAVPSGLPLDEIIEISCHLDVVNAPPAKPLAPQLPILVPEEPQAPAHINGGEVPQAPAHISCAVNGSHEDIDDMRDPRILELQELVSLEWDKLEKMFEECTKKQDSNDDGLFIYF